MSHFQSAFSKAVEFHRSGKINEAIQLYRELCKNEVNNPQLLFMYGVASFQAGSHEGGIGLIQRSIQIEPNPVSYNNLGVMFAQLGRADESIKCFEKVIKLNPDDADGFCNLGASLREAKRYEGALDCCYRAIDLAPKNPQAYLNLGNVLYDLGRYQDSINGYSKYLELAPNFAVGHFGIGAAYYELGELEKALTSYDRAIQLDPNNHLYFYNKGKAFGKLRMLGDAISCYEKALMLNPQNFESYNNLGIVLRGLRRYQEALHCFDQAKALKNDYVEVENNRGLVFKDLGRFDAALICFDKALEIKPDFAESFSNRGEIFNDIKKFDLAVKNYSAALSIKPDIPYLYGAWFHAKMHLSDWAGMSEAVDSIVVKTQDGERVSTPFALLALVDSPSVHWKSSKIFASDKFKAVTALGSGFNSRDSKRITIGYFSSDFFDHATMHLAAEVFENHDRESFRTIAFSFGPRTSDHWQERAREAFEEFIDCSEFSDAEIARLSREKGVDIAIDLKGYTQNARSGIFSERAAPIQVSFLGYPGTMGADWMDYIIADSVVIPESSRGFFLEKVAYLPYCYQPNRRLFDSIELKCTRREHGLPENAFVFSSFNNNYKITPDIFDIWMRILKSVNGSVLWLLRGNAIAEENLRIEAEKRGVGGDRLIFAEPIANNQHLDRLRLANLMLDTHPYGAHTTCSDALRMGLPVLTIKGESFASRVAASLLQAVNLTEMVTESKSAYESLAIQLGNDLDAVAKLRTKLSVNLQNSPLFDPILFSKHLESTYQTMHQRHLDGAPKEHIWVS